MRGLESRHSGFCALNWLKGSGRLARRDVGKGPVCFNLSAAACVVCALEAPGRALPRVELK